MNSSLINLIVICQFMRCYYCCLFYLIIFLLINGLILLGYYLILNFLLYLFYLFFIIFFQNTSYQINYQVFVIYFRVKYLTLKVIILIFQLILMDQYFNLFNCFFLFVIKPMVIMIFILIDFIFISFFGNPIYYQVNYFFNFLLMSFLMIYLHLIFYFKIMYCPCKINWLMIRIQCYHFLNVINLKCFNEHPPLSK